MPHVKGLHILNDWKENQKLAKKLPDWAVTRWSRQVSEALDSMAEYPSFDTFVEFVEKEARIMCNPVISLAALRGPDQSREARPYKSTRESGKGKGMALSTGSQEVHLNRDTSLRSQESYGEESSYCVKTQIDSCPFCDGNHYLSSCPEFSVRSVQKRTHFVRSQKRCFGCLRTGHFTRECRMRHTCQRCHGSHPTVLHDEARNNKREVSTMSA